MKQHLIPDDTREEDVSALSDASTISSSKRFIALFGAHGRTGKHFLRHALDAGYRIRALVPADVGSVLDEFSNQAELHRIDGTLQESDKVRRTIRGVDYVVCMLNDTIPTRREYPERYMTNFVKLLYPLMNSERSIRVFLFQANSLAPDISGIAPVMAQMIKTVAFRRTQFLQDQDLVIRTIAEQHGFSGTAGAVTTQLVADDDNKENKGPGFSFIVTRPSVLLKDGPSVRKLSASKSQPGPFPNSHVDLAEFSLNALLTEQLYDTCPYVVADST